MNSEAFDALVEKAERAKVLVDEIKQLQKADPDGYGHSAKLSGNNGRDLLEIGMLRDVINAGRAKLIADRETELKALLETVPTKTVHFEVGVLPEVLSQQPLADRLLVPEVAVTWQDAEFQTPIN
jgi:hypothetical protein